MFGARAPVMERILKFHTGQGVIAVPGHMADTGAEGVGISGFPERDEEIHSGEQSVFGFDQLQVVPLNTQTGLVQVRPHYQGNGDMTLDRIQTDAFQVRPRQQDHLSLERI